MTGGIRIRRLAAVATLLGALVYRMRARSAQIADLKNNPGRYHDHTVSVEGVVTHAWGVPLVPFRVYKVDDGTGEVTVLSQSGRAPPPRARGSKSGARSNEFGGFGGHSIGLHIREDQLHVEARSWWLAPFRSSSNLDRHRGHVVALRRVATEFLHGVNDRVDDRRGGLSRRRSTISHSRARRRILRPPR